MNESEKRSLIKFFYWANLTESEVFQKEKLKDFIVVLYTEYSKNLRNTGSILRRPGWGRKEKIDDEKFKMIMEILKVDNTLSALDIQKKIIDKGVNVSTSTIRRALKMRKYTYKKSNIATMILASNQMKARKLFWEKYLMEDWSKYIYWWSCFKGGKMRSIKWTTESEKYVISAMKPKCKVNAWGGISINGKIDLYFFTENVNSELYINILKEMLPKMKRVGHKNFILVGNNAPAHVSEATQKFIKEKKINELKDWPAFISDLNPIENV